MVDVIVQSFKRLYQSGKLSETSLNSLINRGIIAESDKEYIMRKDGD